MDKSVATKLLNDTFNQDFDLERFTKFTSELLNELQVENKDCTRYIKKEYHQYISSFIKVGGFSDGSKEMEVLSIGLKRTSSRDRARTMQRNFVADWLSKTNKEAALVAFYGDDDDDWRFSFVKMEYSLVKDESGKVKTVQELTPAKRYSFLVGKNEPNHTCISQLAPILREIKKNPSIAEIEGAFSVEKVTKEFFEKYKALYHKLKESLDKVISKDQLVKQEFKLKSIDSVEFSKKLLGQIVFIYFLQKKGWLGVIRGNDGKFKSWGTGPKDFLRKLFDKKITSYNNFFNDVLEPLFYDALARDRRIDNDYYDNFQCKIPFLNGGLFEPINEYNWGETEITLDDGIFEEILDVFDRFNFTVKEDEPLEKEVAVDPEMLGKVFENLLEVTDRKSKGAFYTPREIVHYMCQQSLINYLETNTEIEREDIEKFIQMGEFATAQDERVLTEIKELQDDFSKGRKTVEFFQKELQIKISKLSLPKSIIDNRDQIDKLLVNIKVVDPAVGSGAFPVGMLNEIVKARSILYVFFNESKSAYDLKREVVENCIYGVDIEPSAVEICKLRFWLSLIVDELDMQNIQPLPNLDHKIMCGNSLLEEFEGQKLFDESLLEIEERDYQEEIKEISDQIRKLHAKGDVSEETEKEIESLHRKQKKLYKEARKDRETQQLTLGEAQTNKRKESQRKLSELKKLQRDYFNEQNREKKKALRGRIDSLEWELIGAKLKEDGNEESIKKLQNYKKSKSKPFFLWKLYFSDVFQRENPGFDVVIGNPPYINANQLKKMLGDKAYKNLKRNFVTAKGTVDLYIYFIEKGINLLRMEGDLIYITPNRYLSASYGKALRKFLLDNTIMLSIADYSSVRVFQEASTYPIVSNYKKSKRTKNNLICIKTYDLEKRSLIEKIVDSDKLSLLNDYIWGFLLNDKIDITLKVIEKSVPLEKSGKINATSTASEADEYHKLINENEGMKIINTGTIDPFTSLWGLKRLTDKGEKYLQPRLKIDESIISKNRINLYQSSKIIFAKIAIVPEAFLDEFGEFASINTNCIHSFTKNFMPKYVLAWVNSKLFQYIFECFFDGLKMSGGYLLYSSPNLINTFIFPASEIQQKEIVSLVEEIQRISTKPEFASNSDLNKQVKDLQIKIDNKIYSFFDFSDKEKNRINGSIRSI